VKPETALVGVVHDLKWHLKAGDGIDDPAFEAAALRLPADRASHEFYAFLQADN
jgi:hypothetical protein